MLNGGLPGTCVEVSAAREAQMHRRDSVGAHIRMQQRDNVGAHTFTVLVRTHICSDMTALVGNVAMRGDHVCMCVRERGKGAKTSVKSSQFTVEVLSCTCKYVCAFID